MRAARALAELAAARSPAIDEDLRAQYTELLERAPEALERDGEVRAPDGRRRHLTASGIVVDRDAEHVALVWHRKGRFWVQPGGHLEADDPDLEAAARREVAEETGLDGLERIGPGPAELNRHALDGGFGPCGEHWDVRFLLRTRAPADRCALRASPESPEVIWAPWPRDDAGAILPGALPEGTVPDFAGTLDALAPLVGP